jgi:phenylacetic acid degradation operon negative regulatory protein
MAAIRNTDPPLSARSLIASLLLRSRPPRMRGSRLVQWCALFGVSEGTARVALSRMVERGELGAGGGVYELAGRVGARRSAQDWSLDPVLDDWNGDWRIGVVPDTGRSAAERTRLRDAMRQLRMAELRAGVWTRPANLPRASAPAEAWAVGEAQCHWWHAQPDDASVALANELFDPRGWATAAQVHTRRLERATTHLPAGLADAFLAGTAAVAQLRADPMLPAELGPSHSAGETLRTVYRAYEAAFSDALRAWFRAHA